MTTTRAKMVCDKIEQDAYGHRAIFSAVCGTTEENEKFFVATPAGSMDLSLLNGKHFEPGKQYYIDITEAVE